MRSTRRFDGIAALAVLAAFGFVVTPAAASPTARVYPANPVSTPQLVEVTLDLPPGASVLENDRVRALTCVDRADVRDTLLGSLHLCHLEAVARADAAGNFLDMPAPDTQPEDAFAEISLFHHSNHGLRQFAELGAELSTQPLPVVANVMWPPGALTGDVARAADPTAPFEPLAGAFYRAHEAVFGAANGILGPALWFGQGPRTDYAYDADVIYHELTHAIVDDRVGVVTHMHADEHGLIDSPAALGEAVADYFAAVLTGDPWIGEHAAPNLRAGLWAYRSIDGDARCPQSLSGEAHHDSAIAAGALWTARTAANDSERALLDRAVLDVAISMPGDAAFEDWARRLVDHVAASTAALGERLTSELERRGLLPGCQRVLRWSGVPLRSTDELRSANAFVAPGRFDTPWTANGRPPVFDFAPGIVQLRVDLREGTRALLIRFDAIGVHALPLVLVRWGAQPMRFSSEGDLDADAMLRPLSITTPAWQASIDVPRGARAAHLMIANQGDFAFAYRDVDLELQDAELSARGGCGCVATGRTRASPAWLSAFVLGIAALRRARWPVRLAQSSLVFPSIRSLERAAAKPGASAFDLPFQPLASQHPALDAWVHRIEALPGYESTYPPHWRS